jgi:serine/threonine protein kinase
MELATEGSLMDYTVKIQRDGSLMTDRECANVIKQILEGIGFLHKRDLIHRDLKPANILLQPSSSNQDFPYKIMIGDFGLVKSIAGGVYKHHVDDQCGTILYQPPEQAAADAYGKVRSSNSIFSLLTYGQLDLSCMNS